MITSGSMFARSMRVYLKTLPPFVFLATLIYSPLIILDRENLQRLDAPSDPARDLIALLAQSIVGNILTGILVLAVLQHLAGRPLLLGECIAQALRRFGLILIVSILVAALFSLGIACLIIPGLYALTLFVVAVPVAVVEGGGPLQALQRSIDLTRGQRWNVFYALLFAALCVVVFWLVLGALFQELRDRDPLTQALMLLPAKALLGVFSAVMPTVIYHDLRAMKEGFHATDVAYEPPTT